MILVTTDQVAGRTIVECLGIVAAETVIRPTTAQMLSLSSDALVKTREDMLFEARETTLDKLARYASARGGDAVVAIRMDFESLEGSTGMLIATGAGTAVRLQPA